MLAKNRKRILSMLLAVIMVLGMLPMSALGAGSGSPYSDRVDNPNPQYQYGLADGENEGASAANHDVKISKTAAATSEENVFDITLTVDSKDRVVPGERVVGADVVLVFDASGSMDWNVSETDDTSRFDKLREAADGFIDNILSDPANRISIVAYAASVGKNNGVVSTWRSSDQKGALKDSYRHYYRESIDDVGDFRWNYLGNVGGGTNCQDGFRAAANMLGSARSEAQKFVVYMSDGEANYYYRETICDKEPHRHDMGCLWGALCGLENHSHNWENGCYDYAMSGGDRKSTDDNDIRAVTGAQKQAEKMKQDYGAILYTVGLGTSDTNGVLSKSNPAVDIFYNDPQGDDLLDIYNTVKDQIVLESKPWTVEDAMSQYVEFVADSVTGSSHVTYDPAGNGSLVWQLGEDSRDEGGSKKSFTITYQVRLKDTTSISSSLWTDAEGNLLWHPTNGTTTLNYKVFKNNKEYPTRTLTFDVPEVRSEVYTVTLKHLVDGEPWPNSEKTFTRIGGYRINLDNEKLALGDGYQYKGRDAYNDQAELVVSSACDGETITYNYISGWPVTVYYKETGTGTELHTPQEGVCKEGETASLVSPEIPGYKLVDANQATVTLDKTNNTATVWYEKEIYHVTYEFSGSAPAGVNVPVDGNSYTMFEGSNRAAVLGMTPQNHWTFNGWTIKDSEDTTVYTGGESLAITGNVTLVGTWTQAEYHLDIVYTLDQTAFEAYQAEKAEAEAEVEVDYTSVPEEWAEGMEGDYDYDAYKAGNAIPPVEEGGATTYPEDMLSEEEFMAQAKADALTNAQAAARDTADAAAVAQQQANIDAFSTKWNIGDYVEDENGYTAYNGTTYTTDTEAGSYVFARQDPAGYHSTDTATVSPIALGEEFMINPAAGYKLTFTEGKDQTAAFNIGNNKFSVTVNHLYYKDLSEDPVSTTMGTATFVNGGAAYTVTTAPKTGYAYLSNDSMLDLTAGSVEVTVTDSDITINIKYQAEKRTVDFVFEGETEHGVEVPAQQSVWHEDKASVPTLTIPQHYEFDGWYTKSTDDDGKDMYTKYDFNASVIENLTLYGKWSLTPYTVTFNFEGEVPSTEQDKTAAMAANPYYAGGTVADPNYSYTNADPAVEYVFDGWYTKNADGTYSDTKYDFSTEISGNLNLYGKWTKTASKYGYTVEYYLDNEYVGTLDSTDAQAVEYGRPLTAANINSRHSGSAKAAIQTAGEYTDAFMGYMDLDSESTVGIESIGAENNVAKLYFETQRFTVTVNYRYFASGSTEKTMIPESVLGQKNPAVVEDLKYGDSYSVTSPSVAHYALDTDSKAVVSGNIEGQNVVEYVDYVELNKYSVTVAYFDLADKDKPEATAIADPVSFEFYTDVTGSVSDEYTSGKTISNYTYAETVGATTGLSGSATIKVYFVRDTYKVNVIHKIDGEDAAAQEILTKQDINGFEVKMGEEYTPQPAANIPANYKLVSATPAQDGTAVKDGTVTYTYTYTEKDNVILNALYNVVDENGELVMTLDTLTETHKEGYAYSLAAKEFAGYSFKEMANNSAPASGTLAKGSNVTVIFNYTVNSYTFRVDFINDYSNTTMETVYSDDMAAEFGTTLTNAEVARMLDHGNAESTAWQTSRMPSGYHLNGISYPTIGVSPKGVYNEESATWDASGVTNVVEVHYNYTPTGGGGGDPTPPTPVDPKPPRPPVDIVEDPVPLAPAPDAPAIEESIIDEDVPLSDLPELPGDEIDIGEDEVPLGDLPQTGAVAPAVNPTTTLGLIALALSMVTAGLAYTYTRKKDEEDN